MAKLYNVLLAIAVVGAQVPESDFYPIIEYWKAGDFAANPLCEGSNAAAIPAKVKDYPSRMSLGLKLFSRDLLRNYDSVARGASPKDINYQGAQRRRTVDWTSLTSNPMAAAAVEARNGVTDRGYREAFCNNLETAKPEEFCMAMANFTKGQQCLSSYEYEDPDRVLSSLLPAVDYGFKPVPQACLQTISAGVDALDLKWETHRQTPHMIPRTTLMAEGRSYYMIQKALDHLQRYSEYKYLMALNELESGTAAPSDGSQSGKAGKGLGMHDLFQNTDVPTYLIPEWKTERVFMINEPRFKGGPTLRTPYATLSSRGSDLLLILRRPMTTYESRLALYNQHSLKYLFNFTGEVHDGASTIYQTMSGLVEIAVTGFLDAAADTLSTPVRITVVGADLPSSGGAVIMASQLQKVLEERFASSSAVIVTTITFGNPLVSDSIFVQDIARRIEVRNIQVQGDSTDLFPCATTYSCDERVLLPRTGIETGKVYSYAPLPGQVRISLEQLSVFDENWGLETSRMQLAALKDCAYSCFLASNFCTAEIEKRCSPQTCEAWL
eukprot:Protomagalhaensia_wolfi_Nauph_80__6076@NODE_855_length_1945_cov_46_465373_g643_i0_p1_GENE_NODE_855_length_1945_cov_46_465373_g643_i0NODE_855_length_1945_cov_46_465373_g643_i0_p1_ORF_typecomplete_len553_score123_92Lipase_3/PF01764_25/0_0057_NODE_855_length_1945_cov_46_465373_g643_i01451803